MQQNTRKQKLTVSLLVTGLHLVVHEAHKVPVGRTETAHDADVFVLAILRQRVLRAPTAKQHQRNLVFRLRENLERLSVPVSNIANEKGHFGIYISSELKNTTAQSPVSPVL